VNDLALSFRRGPEAEGCQNAGLCKSGEYEDKDGLTVRDERWQQKMSSPIHRHSIATTEFQTQKNRPKRRLKRHCYYLILLVFQYGARGGT